jgi:hypothetical protein
MRPRVRAPAPEASRESEALDHPVPPVSMAVITSHAALIVQDIVGPNHLPGAIRLNATSRYLATLFGPAVGGGLMFLLGPRGGILTNVLLYIPLSIFLFGVCYPGHTDGDQRPPRMSRLGFGEMWQLISRRGLDRRIVLMITAWIETGELSGGGVPFLATRVSGSQSSPSPRDIIAQAPLPPLPITRCPGVCNPLAARCRTSERMDEDMMS